MVRIDVDTEKGGLTLNKDVFVDFGLEPKGAALALSIYAILYLIHWYCMYRVGAGRPACTFRWYIKVLMVTHPRPTYKHSDEI